MTRESTCKRTNTDGNIVETSKLECSYLDPPVTQEPCNVDTPCPEWKIIYTACSATCGTGRREDFIEIVAINGCSCCAELIRYIG